MCNLSKFVERLNELISDEKITPNEVAERIGVHRTTLGKYLHGKCYPSTDKLVALCDLFSCSADYLIGYSDLESSKQFKSRPPFHERLTYLLNTFKVSKYRLSKEAFIPESILYQWRDGDYLPSIDNLIKLAKFFDCSIDYILGRES